MKRNLENKGYAMPQVADRRLPSMETHDHPHANPHVGCGEGKAAGTGFSLANYL
jgi:hypothetical protein